MSQGMPLIQNARLGLAFGATSYTAQQVSSCLLELEVVKACCRLPRARLGGFGISDLLASSAALADL